MSLLPFPWRPALARAALFGSAFVVSSAALLAVAASFDAVSREPFLRDTPEARLAVARCDALRERGARDACVHRLVVAARERDRGAALVAAAHAPPGAARR